MDDVLALQELENLAGELSIEIRYDDVDGEGGLCRFAGKTCLILSSALSTTERVRMVSRALSRYSLDEMFVRPSVRELIERCGSDD